MNEIGRYSDYFCVRESFPFRRVLLGRPLWTRGPCKHWHAGASTEKLCFLYHVSLCLIRRRPSSTRGSWRRAAAGPCRRRRRCWRRCIRRLQGPPCPHLPLWPALYRNRWWLSTRPHQGPPRPSRSLLPLSPSPPRAWPASRAVRRRGRPRDLWRRGPQIPRNPPLPRPPLLPSLPHLLPAPQWSPGWRRRGQ